MQTDQERIQGAATWLVMHFGKMGGGAKYIGFKACEVPLYNALMLFKKYKPSFDPDKYLDERFLGAAESALPEVNGRLAEVVARDAELLREIQRFVLCSNVNLSERQRSGHWTSFLAELGALCPTVDKELAEDIAWTYLSKHKVEGVSGIAEVRDFGEDGMREPGMYDPHNEKMYEKCWVAYGRPSKIPGKIVFKSSYVILVDKHSGEVVFAGSAHDEG